MLKLTHLSLLMEDSIVLTVLNQSRQFGLVIMNVIVQMNRAN